MLTPELEKAAREQHEQLRQEILAGAEQIKQGQYSTYASADDLIAEIVAAGQQRLAASQ